MKLVDGFTKALRSAIIIARLIQRRPARAPSDSRPMLKDVRPIKEPFMRNMFGNTFARSLAVT